jgi:thiol-disulfide isomerase/thioredoxin
MRIKQSFYTLAIVVMLSLLLLNYMYSPSEGFASSAGGEGVDTFTMFYADWCPHCKTVKPAFQSWGADKGSVQVNGKTVFVKMLEADAAGTKEKMTEAGVKGFPTFMLFKSNGQKMEFEGDRSPAGWEAWLKKNV